MVEDTVGEAEEDSEDVDTCLMRHPGGPPQSFFQQDVPYFARSFFFSSIVKDIANGIYLLGGSNIWGTSRENHLVINNAVFKII